MNGIRFPSTCWQGIMDISPQKAMAHMEEEKTFMAPAFVVISLPVAKRLKKRSVRRRIRHHIKRVNPKANADWSMLKR